MFWRNIGGAVLGYVVTFVAVFILMSVMWMVMGGDGAFQPESWDVSGGWIAGSIVVGLVAAIAGGAVCGKVAASHHGVWILIGVVVVLGVLLALDGANPAAEVAVGARTPDVGMMDAMMSARPPSWMAWLHPLVGAIGTFYGARLVKGV